MNFLEHRLSQTLLFGILPLVAGLWILTWIPHRDVLHPWIAAGVGTLVLAAELGAVHLLTRLAFPENLQAIWRLLRVSLTAGGGLFAALLSRYLGGPVPWGQILIAVALGGVIFWGLIWRHPAGIRQKPF